MKTQQKLLMVLLMAIVLYLVSFFIEQSYLATKMAIILATGPLLYAIMLYSIKTKVMIFKDPLGLDIERKSFFGRNFYVLFISLLLTLFGFQWTHHMVIWIQANGILSFESLWFLFCITSMLFVMGYQMIKKETRQYWCQIPYTKRIWISILQLILLIIAIVYDPRSLVQSMINIAVILVVVFGISWLKDLSHKRKSKEHLPESQYYDCFAKPERSR